MSAARSPLEVLSSAPVGMFSTTELIATARAVQRLVGAAKAELEADDDNGAAREELAAAVEAMERAP